MAPSARRVVTGRTTDLGSARPPASGTDRGTDRQRGARGRVPLESMMDLGNLDIEIRQGRCRQSTQMEHQVDAHAHIGRYQHRDPLRRRAQTSVRLGVETGHAAYQRHRRIETGVNERQGPVRQREIDQHVGVVDGLGRMRSQPHPGLRQTGQTADVGAVAGIVGRQQRAADPDIRRRRDRTQQSPAHAPGGTGDGDAQLSIRAHDDDPRRSKNCLTPSSQTALARTVTDGTRTAPPHQSP